MGIIRKFRIQKTNLERSFNFHVKPTKLSQSPTQTTLSTMCTTINATQEPVWFQINLLQCQKRVECSCDTNGNNATKPNPFATQISTIVPNYFHNYCTQLRIQRKLVILQILQSYKKHNT